MKVRIKREDGLSEVWECADWTASWSNNLLWLVNENGATIYACNNWATCEVIDEND